MKKYIFSWLIPLKWWIFYGYVGLQECNLQPLREQKRFITPQWLLPSWASLGDSEAATGIVSIYSSKSNRDP